MSPAPPAGLPWETGSGPVGGLPATVYRVLLFPGRAFDCPPAASWQRAAAFAFVVSSLPPLFLLPLGLAPGLSLWVATLVAVPVHAGILHLGLWAMGGGRGGYDLTFRVTAYCQAAVLWTLIPGLGIIIFAGWHLVIMILGLARAQGIGLGFSIALNLIPVAVSLILSLAMGGLSF